MKRLALPFPIALLVGCDKSPPPDTDSRIESTGATTMRQFRIGNTDFGIDPEASSFMLDTTDPERPTITIALSGDRSPFDSLTADDDSEWSWSLYPPDFYLRSFPAQIDPSTGIVMARVKLDEIDNPEFAILMMEHNNIVHTPIAPTCWQP